MSTLLLTASAAALVVYAWILLVDPYQNVWLSPPLERGPVGGNQRFTYPALARSPHFDSLILGTSSIRLLKPGELNRLLDASFANLAMNAATVYEQSRMLDLFIRHHPEARYAIHAVDDFWCNPFNRTRRLTERPFPEWMYDENQWNDLLYLFNATAVEKSWRQFRNVLGLRSPSQGKDGYSLFVPPDSEYDFEKVRHKIYEDAPPHLKPSVQPPEEIDPNERSTWTFPNLASLRAMVDSLPAETTKVLVMPPYHQMRLPAPGSAAAAQLDDCKARIQHMVAEVPRTTLIDFMFRSSITLRDESRPEDTMHEVRLY